MSRIVSFFVDFHTALSNWGRIILFLMASDISQKFRASRLGIILAFIEPLILINMFILGRVVIRHQMPQFGDSTAVFISSGVLPFYVFRRVSMRGRDVKYNAVQRIPGANSTDHAIASALAEAVLILTVLIFWFAAMWAYGLDEAEPVSISNCIASLFFLLVFGFGVGLINSAISRHFSLWNNLYGYLTFGLMMMSGVFFLVDVLPLNIRDIMVWNPLTHGIEWFRLGLYGLYPVHTLDPEYLVACSIGALFLGFIAHRSTLRSE